MLKTVASLIDNARIIINNRSTFMIQATELAYFGNGIGYNCKLVITVGRKCQYYEKFLKKRDKRNQKQRQLV
jgi:hypothetical protein